MLTRRDFSKSLLASSALLASGPSTFAAQMQETHRHSDAHQDIDLLIKGGRVVDPAQRTNALMDVAVKDGKILEVAVDIPESRAKRVFSAKDRLVTPGLIDIHVHAYDGVTACMNADHYCMPRGTTTCVDAGSMGYLFTERFVEDIVRNRATRVYALVHIAALGAVTGLDYVQDNLDWVDPEPAAEAANAYKPAIVGIKVHLQASKSRHPKELELEFTRRGIAAAEASHLPLMAHLNDTYYPLGEHLKLMRKGDVFTHCFNDFPTTRIIDANGHILPEVRDARDRGIIFDTAIGHGHPHFRFNVAEKCLQQGFLPDTISTDLNDEHATEYVFDLPTTVSKFMALGMDLNTVLERVTVNPTRVFDYGVKLGTLSHGSEADIGIFALNEGQYDFVDGGGTKRTGHQMFVNKAVVCRGKLYVNQV
ncbi:MAG TPA: amidohydrolase family protein [Acidobacteriaceae bacterium]|jgi:dihydroorotase